MGKAKAKKQNFKNTQPVLLKIITDEIIIPAKKVISKYYKSEQLPIYIAFTVFFSLFIIANNVVTYDTNDHITSYRKMQRKFNGLNYNLRKVRSKKQKVPRVFIKTLPKDFAFIESKNDRKDLFIKFLLPLLLRTNEEIMIEREKLLKINNKIKAGKKLKKLEKEWLKDISNSYGVNPDEIDNLISKVDKISISMALGQAIQETGWGTSRFLLEGNAIFAEWTWKREGMVPRTRKEGDIHRIKTFATLMDSVHSYTHNLNSTRFYTTFRKVRENQRKAGKTFDGTLLINTMVSYSTEKGKYMSNVRQIIRNNRLTDFDDIELEPSKDKKKKLDYSEKYYLDDRR